MYVVNNKRNCGIFTTQWTGKKPKKESSYPNIIIIALSQLKEIVNLWEHEESAIQRANTNRQGILWGH